MTSSVTIRAVASFFLLATFGSPLLCELKTLLHGWHQAFTCDLDLGKASAVLGICQMGEMRRFDGVGARQD